MKIIVIPSITAIRAIRYYTLLLYMVLMHAVHIQCILITHAHVVNEPVVGLVYCSGLFSVCLMCSAGIQHLATHYWPNAIHWSGELIQQKHSRFSVHTL